MKYEEIIGKIAHGLTGDPKKDIKYLMEQGELYKTHELASEILRGIGRLISDAIPQENRKEIEQLIKNEENKVQTIIEEAEFQIHKKNFSRALEILESAIKDIEDDNGRLRRYFDDSVSEYHHFRNYLEEVLYIQTTKPERTVREMPENIGYLYHVCGFLYFETGRFDEAKVVLEKARKINPVDTEAIFELGEIYKRNGEWDHYLELSELGLSLSYTRSNLARSYRNLGFYYIEQQKYDVATALYHMSMFYDPKSIAAQSELFIIQQITNKVSSVPSSDDIEKILEENKIQLGPNVLILEIAEAIGAMAEEGGHYEAARHYYSVLYDLTLSEEVKKHMDNLPKEDLRGS